MEIPWYYFWHPRSGGVGGIIFTLLWFGLVFAISRVDREIGFLVFISGGIYALMAIWLVVINKW
jgi:hypothetical protein